MMETPPPALPRALVAEDDPGVRAFVSRALTHAGFDVTDVEDGQQALEALEIQDYALLVADIMMPVVDGIALALSAARHQPALRIVLITGYPAEHRRARNLDALVHAVLAKPFGIAELCDAALGTGKRC